MSRKSSWLKIGKKYREICLKASISFVFADENKSSLKRSVWEKRHQNVRTVAEV